tara:strand:+ start:3813 stop:4889 length:1077 start_codon:yes stop_codon:yes gene_type:complete
MQSYRVSITGIFFFWALSLNAQTPDYYSDINFEENGLTLLSQLSLITAENQTVFFPYTSWETDVWDVLRMSDIDGETSNVLLIYGHDNDDNAYTNDRTRNFLSTCHSYGCIGLWNREHIFAKSLANPNLQLSTPGPGTDLHNIRAIDAEMNSVRSNRLFGEGNGNAKITEEGNFYPGDEWKGDVARALMYMYIRYPSQCDLFSVSYGVSNFSKDLPDILLDWNAEDPVSEFELKRNDIIYSYQGNRNPFVDNYALAYHIWGGPKLLNLWDDSKKEFKNKLRDVRFNIDITPYVTDGDIFVFSDEVISEVEYSLIDYNGNIVDQGTVEPVIDFDENLSGVYTLVFKQENRSKSFEIMIE